MKNVKVEQRMVYVLVTNTQGFIEVLSVHPSRHSARRAYNRHIKNWGPNSRFKQECFIDWAMFHYSVPKSS
jgi:hypothetical protein